MAKSKFVVGLAAFAAGVVAGLAIAWWLGNDRPAQQFQAGDKIVIKTELGDIPAEIKAAELVDRSGFLERPDYHWRYKVAFPKMEDATWQPIDDVFDDEPAIKLAEKK